MKYNILKKLFYQKKYFVNIHYTEYKKSYYKLKLIQYVKLISFSNVLKK